MDEIPQEKICTKCSKSKPLADFNKSARSKDGHRPECRSCQQLAGKDYAANRQDKAARTLYDQSYRELNKDKISTYMQMYAAKRKADGVLEQPPEEKTCIQCGQTKPIEDFGTETLRKDGKSTKCLLCKAERGRELHAQNLEGRHAQRKREYDAKKALGQKRERNPRYFERSRERHQERMQEEPEVIRAHRQRASKTYREKHPDRIFMRNKTLRPYWRERGRVSRRDHPEIYTARMERRRARKQGLPDTWTPAQVNFMLQYWQHSCAICGNPKGLFWTLAHDHWIPLASPNCPGTIATNMIPLCHGNDGCNNSKNASEPSVWLVKRFGATKAAKIEKVIHTYFAQIALAFAEGAA